MYNPCLISGEITVYSMAGEGNSSNQQDPPLAGLINQTYKSLRSPYKKNDDTDETCDELNRNR